MVGWGGVVWGSGRIWVDLKPLLKKVHHVTQEALFHRGVEGHRGLY